MSCRVKFEHVTKRYKMYHNSVEKIKDLLLSREGGEYHYALHDVSFEVGEGEVVGIIGLNGSGKSTLSNLIAGVTIPNEGNVDIYGTSALIAISSGLNPQLTGFENIELKGLMMGLTKGEIQDIIPKVIEFAEIGKFMNQPVKTYSSGMKSRLGFAISVHIDPDILVIDEALSVGDPTFTQKCLDKMNEFKEKGKTIFFISHSLAQVRRFCTKGLWLYYGTVREYGHVEEVADHYTAFLKEYNSLTMEERKKVREEELAHIQHGLLEDDIKTVKKTFRIRRGRIAMLSAALLTGSIGTGTYVLQQGEAEVRQESAVSSVREAKKQYEPAANVLVIKGNSISIQKEPNKQSERIALANFGDTFQVREEKLDEERGIVLSQVTTADGRTGWINVEDAVILHQPALSDDGLQVLDAFIEKQYGSSPFSFMLQLSSIQRELKTEAAELNKISFHDVQMSPAELTSILGNAAVIHQGSYFYETEHYYVTAEASDDQTMLHNLSIMEKAW